jgi:hypothetical protein
MDKMEKLKRLNLEKKILIVEAIFILGVFAYLFLAVPKQISPVSGKAITNSEDFVFEIANGEEIWISMSNNFANPIILKEGDEITLPPGEYYWKIKGLLRDSAVKTFTIQALAGLDLSDNGDNSKLENSGNLDLNVEKKKDSTITTFPLDSGEEIDVAKDDSTYKGGQK